MNTAQALSPIIHLDAHREHPASSIVTILDLPIKRVIDSEEEIRWWIDMVGHFPSSRLDENPFIHLRECAHIYACGRRVGLLVTTAAMPPVQAKTCTWLDQHDRIFRGTFPVRALLPFLEKGRG